jgi:hypothetical protein
MSEHQIILEAIIMIYVFHFIGDFLLQTQWMSLNKSNDLKALTTHCIVYSIPFLWFGLKYAAINGVLHFIVDYFTSKFTKRTAEDQNWRLFFIIIGFDQMLHMIILTLTLYSLVLYV